MNGVVLTLSGGMITKRELDALRCASYGLSLEETAQRLRCSRYAAGWWLEQAQQKLGARTLANAVALAYEEGLFRQAACPCDALAEERQRIRQRLRDYDARQLQSHDRRAG